MFRPAIRTAARAQFTRAAPRIRTGRRLVSTAPPHQKSRSWKSSAARWGLAGALVYYYNTTTVFAEEPAYVVYAPPETSQETETYPTVASVSEERRAQSRSAAPTPQNAPQTTTYAVPDDESPAPGSPEELEAEANQEGAFNEETGEINWDCPCLGGMAHGPCGEQFRAAFSCFVFSKEEPKGVDCIEQFKTMQNCFREHPEIYGAEMEDDEIEPEAEGEAVAPAASEQRSAKQGVGAEFSDNDQKTSNASRGQAPSESSEALAEQRERATAASQQVKREHGAASDEEEVPQPWHDARAASQSS